LVGLEAAVEEQGPVFRDAHGRPITIDRISGDRIALTRQHSATVSEFWTLPAAEARRLAEEILRLTGSAC
jgi:hypothetical protein